MPALPRRLMLVSALAAAGAAAQPAASATIRGTTRPRQLATLGPQADGVVREITVEEGSRVTAGQVLLRLAEDVQAARVALARQAALAEGELRQAEAQAAEAAAQAARMTAAQARGGAMAWEVRQAAARQAVAEAALEAARERRMLEQRRLELELAQAELLLVRAPFDGQVVRLDISVGAPLARSDRPITVADLTVLEATLYVPAAYHAQLRTGAAHRLRLSAPADREVAATLRFVDPMMDTASGRFRAVFTIANPDGAIPAGVEAELTLPAPA